MNQELARVVGYIMYSNLLEDVCKGSFYLQIDLAIIIAEKFIENYSDDIDWENQDMDWDEAIEKFLENYIKNK